MKIDIAKLLRVAFQIAAAAPVVAAALRPVLAELKPKSGGS